LGYGNTHFYDYLHVCTCLAVHSGGALIELIQVSPVAADSPQPIEVIEDNSFLIEEAYNQEAESYSIFSPPSGGRIEISTHTSGVGI